MMSAMHWPDPASDASAAPGRGGLEVRAMRKSFGAALALKDMSVRLRAGSVHSLLGENGAGKSTLMKILAGVLQPSPGQMLIDGQGVRLRGAGGGGAGGGGGGGGGGAAGWFRCFWGEGGGGENLGLCGQPVCQSPAG